MNYQKTLAVLMFGALLAAMPVVSAYYFNLNGHTYERSQSQLTQIGSYWYVDLGNDGYRLVTGLATDPDATYMCVAETNSCTCEDGGGACGG